MTSGTRVFGWRQPDRNLRRRLQAQSAERGHQHELEQTVGCSGHGFGIKHAIAVLADGLFRIAEVVVDWHESGAAHQHIPSRG
jgi:hypothetical protein